MELFAKCSHPQAEAARAAGIYPYFHELESRQAPEVVMEGKRRIMLGSNNYLGLTTHPRVIQAGRDALEAFGSGCSGSRFLNGTLCFHRVSNQPGGHQRPGGQGRLHPMRPGKPRQHL